MSKSLKKKKIDLVFLVGGYGSRIKKYLKGKPKPFLSFNNYIFLDLLIRNFCKYNINKIFILAGYKGHIIKKKFHKKRINLVDIECLIENKPLGTGGCLSQLKNKIDNDFIVLNGDTYFDIDLSRIIKYRLNKNEIFMSLVKNTNYKSNSKLINLSLRKKFIYYNNNSNFINAGIYKFKKNFLNIISKKYMSLEADIIPDLINRKKVKGLIFKNFFLDIGTPENYRLAQRRLIKYMTRPAIFLDRDGTLNKDKGYTYRLKDLEFLNGVVRGLKLLTAKNYYLFIVTNQAGIAKGHFSENDFLSFQRNMKYELSNLGIYIHDIEYSPYHPKSKIKKYKKKSNLRKPGNQMIENIKRKWPIDFKKTFMIGDKRTDELCAKKSRIKFVYTNYDFLNLIKSITNNY